MKRSRAARLLLSARHRAGITQADLARRTGIPHSVLSAYEHGRREPGADTLARILGAAGFELSLEPRAIDPERAGRELAQVLELADRLPRKRRGRLTYPRVG
jgi:transcriptional regulator with XRE-family HTH domain